MLTAVEYRMRLYPASRFGLWERGRSDFERFEELERRHFSREHDYEDGRSKPIRTIGEVAAAAVMLVLFWAVVTVIARVAGDVSDTGYQPVAAAPDAQSLAANSNSRHRSDGDNAP